MAYSIHSPAQSFVQFSETGVISHCVFENLRFCLPVYADNDVAFQFYINGTESEIDALCGVYGSPIAIGIVNACDDEDFLLEFTANPYNDVPNMFRLSPTQMLVNWSHGFPGFTGVIGFGECFKVRVQIGLTQFCSNCFERTADNCFTSVVEYGCDENCFQFNYCGSGAAEEEELSCEPTIITFTNQSTLSVPYTQSLKDKYGDVPNVTAWIADGSGDLINMSITIAFDAYPVNQINADFGGNASGILVIK